MCITGRKETKCRKEKGLQLLPKSKNKEGRKERNEETKGHTRTHNNNNKTKRIDK